MPLQYSKKLNKLFINQNRSVQIYFKVLPYENYVLPNSGLYIRALCIYTRPDDFPLAVRVCPEHYKNRFVAFNPRFFILRVNLHPFSAWESSAPRSRTT